MPSILFARVLELGGHRGVDWSACPAALPHKEHTPCMPTNSEPTTRTACSLTSVSSIASSVRESSPRQSLLLSSRPFQLFNPQLQCILNFQRRSCIPGEVAVESLPNSLALPAQTLWNCARCIMLHALRTFLKAVDEDFSGLSTTQTSTPGNHVSFGPAADGSNPPSNDTWPVELQNTIQIWISLAVATLSETFGCILLPAAWAQEAEQMGAHPRGPCLRECDAQIRRSFRAGIASHEQSEAGMPPQDLSNRFQALPCLFIQSIVCEVKMYERKLRWCKTEMKSLKAPLFTCLRHQGWFAPAAGACS